MCCLDKLKGSQGIYIGLYLMSITDSFEFFQPTYIENTQIALVNLSNLSSIPLLLNYKGKYTFHDDYRIFIISLKASK